MPHKIDFLPISCAINQLFITTGREMTIYFAGVRIYQKTIQSLTSLTRPQAAVSIMCSLFINYTSYKLLIRLSFNNS